MRSWTIKTLTENIRKRFKDPYIYLQRDPEGRLIVYRHFVEKPDRPAKLIKLESGASKDYILRRLYEMDTWTDTFAQREIDLDVTEDLIKKYEEARLEKADIIKEQDEYTKNAKKRIVVE